MEKLQLSRTHLLAIARNQGNPDLRYEKAFYMFLFGSPTTVHIFEILISWLPYAKRTDGSIYKSDVELAKESGLSPKTVERARKVLKESVFEVVTRKANGAPTSHCRFDLEKFLHFVATKLNTTVEQVRAWIETVGRQKDKKDLVNQTESLPSLSQIATDQVYQMDLVKSAESLTESLTTEINNSIENNKQPTRAREVTSSEVQVSSDGRTGCSQDRQLEFEIDCLHEISEIPQAKIKGWVKEYGFHKVNNFIRYAVKSRQVRNIAAWVQRALESNYRLDRKLWRPMTHGLDYTTGKYADCVHW